MSTDRKPEMSRSQGHQNLMLSPDRNKQLRLNNMYMSTVHYKRRGRQLVSIRKSTHATSFGRSVPDAVSV